MHRYYPNLFAPLRIGNIVLKNHMIAAPSKPHFVMGPENFPAAGLIKHYANKAKNGAALVVANGACDQVYEAGIPGFSFDVYNEKTQHYMGQMTEAVHFYGAKISYMCLFNTPGGYDCSAGVPSHKTVGDDSVAVEGKEMSEEQIEELVQAYVRYCKTIQGQAVDGVFLHFAYHHGTVSRFLSPLTNKRTDRWGGSYENRTRLAYRVLDSIREACGPDFIVEASLSYADPLPGGWTIEDTIRFAREMTNRVDLLQVRSSEIDPCHPTGFETNPTPFLEFAAQVKAANPNCLIEGIAGFFDPDAAEQALAEGKVDCISMARPFISNPNYGYLVDHGRKDDLVPCIRCNRCHWAYYGAPYITVCSVNPSWGMEHIHPDLVVKPTEKKRVAVVGGGPGGMKVALTCAERGHDVALYEKTDALGGILKYTDLPSFKWPERRFKDYLIKQVAKSDVKVLLNTEATPELIEAEDYDAVVIAIGGHPVRACIPGMDCTNVVSPLDAYFNEAALAKKVVVVGCGETGVECALFLAQKGHDVTVLARREALAPQAFRVHFYTLFMQACEVEPGFHALLKVRCNGIYDDHVTYLDENDVEHSISCGTVVAATGHEADSAEVMAFAKAARNFYLVGDCAKAGTIQTTIRSAWTIGSTI